RRRESERGGPKCKIDDCGWGFVFQNQNLNSTAEYLFENLRNYSQEKTQIYERETIFREKKEIYTVYKIQVMFDQSLIPQAKELQTFYFTPYLYKNMKDYPFNYTTYSVLDSMFNKISYYIIWLALFLSFYSILLIFLELKNTK
ncbi:MAG: hypothetical protein AABY22_09005, partial [Nanoarchaeota archaeon]